MFKISTDQTGNILKLLEEVHELRDQLGARIQSNMELSNELRKKLEESGGNLDLSGFEIRANQSLYVARSGKTGLIRTSTDIHFLPVR